ncbi:MAG: fumarylacetoacetate hydrolase [Rhodoferax sp.]|nr:fumarylacetoacetate hydrolase [Rhodoferax sp.]
MKLATLNDGSRDGQLVVVSRDLSNAHYATGIANHLQQVLEDWNFYSPQLQDLYVALNHGKARHTFPFDACQCLAPLPRAYLLAVGDAYAKPGVVEAQPETLRLAFADVLQGACAPLTCSNDKLEPDFAASLAVVTGDVPPAATPTQALESVRLLLLASHTCYRAWQDQPTLAWQSQPSTSFSPVAVTPDELVWGGESAWAQGRLNLTLQCSVNGRKLGLCEAGSDMTASFGELIARLSQVRGLRCGSIVSSGEVRNLEVSRGACSIAARRAQEAAQHGKSKTPWLAQDDQLVIDMKGRDGQSVFGAITQDVNIGQQRAASPRST